MASFALNYTDRPNNNLLRRLSPSDFSLVAPHLTGENAESNSLLYNPGDDVDTVHFPCDGSLASYLVAGVDPVRPDTRLV